jgi:HTH-type transcriptional regulator / antitoxin HigA
VEEPALIATWSDEHMATKTTSHTEVADDYLQLVKRFPLVPIRSAGHLRDAFKVLDELSVIDEDRLTRGQADYLSVLTDLVEKYEDRHDPVHGVFEDGVAALEYLLDQHDMTASDLGRLLGNRQLGSAIVRRQRQLSKEHVLKLADHFKVSTDLLLRPRDKVAHRAS